MAKVLKILNGNKMMLIITNITSKKKLENKVRREQEVLKMIVQISSESEAFYDAKKDYEFFIENYSNYINESKTSLHNINEIYRLIHTFKGTFSQLHINNVVKFLHSIETDISQMIKKNTHTNKSILKLLNNNDFKSNLNKELDIIQNILGNDFLNSQNFIKINSLEISKLENKVHSFFQEEGVKSPKTQEIIEQISNLSSQKIITLLRPYKSLVQQLAMKLEKEIYEIDIVCDDNIIVNDNYKPFIKSLIHVFRNSVDHGIEEPDERMENNKDKIGTISCNISTFDNKNQIIISDDGRGIDKDKVISKAIEENIVNKDEVKNLSENEIYSLIFHEHFSTKSEDEVSDISGRGIGMSAVKVEIEKLAGSISINSQKNVGTTFIFTLPK